MCGVKKARLEEPRLIFLKNYDIIIIVNERGSKSARLELPRTEKIGQNRKMKLR